MIMRSMSIVYWISRERFATKRASQDDLVELDSIVLADEDVSLPLPELLPDACCVKIGTAGTSGSSEGMSSKSTSSTVRCSLWRLRCCKVAVPLPRSPPSSPPPSPPPSAFSPRAWPLAYLIATVMTGLGYLDRLARLHVPS